MSGTLLRVLLALTAAAAAMPATVQAATFTVNSTADSSDINPGNGLCAAPGGVCTLRAAIVESNALSGADTVVVPAGTYVAATSLTVTKSITISAPAGPRATIIDGPNNATALGVNGAEQVQIEGLAIAGAQQGVHVNNSEVTFTRSWIRNNTLSSAGQVDGGGILVTATGQVVLLQSAVTANTAQSSGSDALGGGIRVYPGGRLEVISSTIAGNTASAPAPLETSFGGGIAATDATVVLRHATLANNTVTSGSSAIGGNIYAGNGSTTIGYSIISNGASSNPVHANCSIAGGAFITVGKNLDSGTGCGFGAGQSGLNPLLGAFGNNGGPTDSFVPGVSSPVIGQAVACHQGGTDQRGAPAPSGAGCDLGAVERSADLEIAVTSSRSQVVPGDDVTFFVRVKNIGFDTATAAALALGVGGADGAPQLISSGGACPTASSCDLVAVDPGDSVLIVVVAKAGAAGSPLQLTATGSTSTADASAANDSATLAVPVVADPVGGAGSSAGGNGAGSAADTTPPVLGALKRSGTWRPGRAWGMASSLSEDATVTLTVTRLSTGRRSGKRCSVTARSGKRCTVRRVAGTVVVKARAGALKITVPAKLKGRKLARGKYVVSAVAADAAGNRSKARTLTVSVR